MGSRHLASHLAEQANGLPAAPKLSVKLGEWELWGGVGGGLLRRLCRERRLAAVRGGGTGSKFCNLYGGGGFR